MFVNFVFRWYFYSLIILKYILSEFFTFKIVCYISRNGGNWIHFKYIAFTPYGHFI